MGTDREWGRHIIDILETLLDPGAYPVGKLGKLHSTFRNIAVVRAIKELLDQGDKKPAAGLGGKLSVDAVACHRRGTYLPYVHRRHFIADGAQKIL